jgi:hypothetical protein
MKAPFWAISGQKWKKGKSGSPAPICRQDEGEAE